MFFQANTIKVVVLVEKTELSRQYFWPVQKFIVLELGLTLIPVTSQKEAANMLAALVCGCQTCISIIGDLCIDILHSESQFIFCKFSDFFPFLMY